MNQSPCDWRDKRRHLDAASEIETEATCHNIRPNSQQAVPDRTEGTSAREPGAVSRRSVLSTRARGSVNSQIPLRDYFLRVGGALLVLLFAANSLLPAPLPSKLIESHFTRPPIRITSDLKGPEAVVIETSQPNFLPVLPGKEFSVPPSPPPSSEVADAARQSSQPAPSYQIVCRHFPFGCPRTVPAEQLPELLNRSGGLSLESRRVLGIALRYPGMVPSWPSTSHLGTPWDRAPSPFGRWNCMVPIRRTFRSQTWSRSSESRVLPSSTARGRPRGSRSPSLQSAEADAGPELPLQATLAT